ncbi:hypothetical protein V8E36_008787 [Tilletia maclaganii]
MHFSPTTATTAALALASSVLLLADASSAAVTTWSLNKTYNARDFLSDFEWYTKTDPTHGLINYQSQSASLAANLTEVRGDSLFLRVDTTPTALQGRSSNRITSKAAFGDGIYVLNVSHVPYGCSVWPAWWTVTVDYDTGAWPAGGEIDIIENANDQFSGNLVALHTNPGCTIPSTSSTQKASTQIQYTDCNGKTAQNTGCRMMLGSNPPTWGAPLNKAGGGLFVMRRDLSKGGSGISMWFFARGSEPADLRAGSRGVNPAGWGFPNAHFDVASTCASYFGPHYIVINTALAGDFAAATWSQSGTCQQTYGAITDQVAYRGDSYSTAYWQIRTLRVFTPALASGSSSTRSSSSTTRRTTTSTTTTRRLTSTTRTTSRTTSTTTALKPSAASCTRNAVCRSGYCRKGLLNDGVTRASSGTCQDKKASGLRCYQNVSGRAYVPRRPA